MLKPNRSKFYLQSNRKNEWATVEEEQQARQAALEEQLKTLQAVLPDILKKFDRIPDPRRPRSTRHKLTVVLLFGLLLFVFRYNSRREANREMTRPGVLEYVLEAALVGPQGIALPLMTEFCENPFDNSEQKKQNCERKAFYRLSVRLKALFPKQSLMLAADGLYPNGPVMALCRADKWDFMIVLPNEVCLSTVWTEAKAIQSLEPGQKLVNQWGSRTQNPSYHGFVEDG